MAGLLTVPLPTTEGLTIRYKQLSRRLGGTELIFFCGRGTEPCTHGSVLDHAETAPTTIQEDVVFLHIQY